VCKSYNTFYVVLRRYVLVGLSVRASSQPSKVAHNHYWYIGLNVFQVQLVAAYMRVIWKYHTVVLYLCSMTAHADPMSRPQFEAITVRAKGTVYPRMAVFWIISPCGLVVVSRRFRGARRNTPEDSHLHTYLPENLKSQLSGSICSLTVKLTSFYFTVDKLIRWTNKVGLMTGVEPKGTKMIKNRRVRLLLLWTIRTLIQKEK
jgi:hypothetical protein